MNIGSFLAKNLKYFLPAVFSLPFFLIFGILEGDWLSGVLFLLGLYLGMILLFADEKWFFDFYKSDTASHTTGLVLPKLVTRSTLFLLALVPLTIFVLTSSGSLLGIGMVLGIQLGLLEEMWRFWKMSVDTQNLKTFQNRFCHDLRRPLTPKDIRFLVVGGSFFFGISIFLTIL